MAGLLASVSPLSAALQPADLRCEYSSQPLGVDAAQPRLAWKDQNPDRAQQQSAWQILVASSPALLAQDKGDLWDSGKVASEATVHVPYAGKELTSSEQVFWKVRVWDQADAVSAWSPVSTWTMGQLEADDWHGLWICGQADTETLLLRKEFDVKPGLKRALVHVCGLGQYELHFNGLASSADLFTPGWTEFNAIDLYDTLDVTALLQTGRNALGLELGNGMYNVVRRNRFVKFSNYSGPLRAILDLRLEYADGSVQVLGTDESWSAHAGPTIYANIYGGEDYDARLNPQGWDKPGFLEQGWTRAVAQVRPSGELRGQTAAANPLRVIETNQPVAILPIPGTNDVVYDLGQNTSHIVRLRVSGPAGSVVRMTPGEILGDDGRINRGTMGGTGRGWSWWEYTKATDAPETWTAKFFYVGCRYLQVHLSAAQPAGALPKIESLEGLVVHSIAEPTGDFATSSELLNRIRTLVRWAQRANMVSVLTDCPHREKLGWLEQYHLNGPSIRYEFDVARIYTKGMNDMAQAQLPDGMVPNIAPEYTKFKGAFRAAAEWGASFILVPWQQYQFEADTQMLQRHYPEMKRYFGWLEKRAQDGIVSDGLGDWFDLGPRKPGAAQLTPPPVTASAFYYYDAFILSKIATILNQPEEAKSFAAKAEQIRAAYNRHFYKPDQGSYATGSQCANALPLVLGIVEPQNRPAVEAALLKDLQAHDYAMTAGDIGFRFLLQALAQAGQSEAIFKMINQDAKPGYGYMLKKGATSLTESWDANHSTSHDHFMLGQITEWFYKDLAGIESDPAGPGFKKILIHPTPVGDLKWVEATYRSIRGPIAVRWDHAAAHFTLKVSIPANTTATVFVPASSAETVTESGQAIPAASAIRLLRFENGRAVYEVPSGTYTFASTL